MKASGQRIYTLIQGLSKKERRFLIRSFSSGGKRKSEWYRKLFLHYEAKESFEEANEKSELEAQGFPGHVAVLKNQLFNWILKEMHTYHHTVQKDNWTNLEGMYWKAMYLKKKAAPRWCQVFGRGQIAGH